MKKIVLTALATYFVILALLFFFQRNLQYMPMGKVEKVADGFREIQLTTEDRIKILAWIHDSKDAQKAILFFHGNAGNLADREEKLQAFVKRGFAVLAISYRGYFGSQGKPSEAGLMMDADAAYKFLLGQGYPTKNIILFGESLGSGVAIQFAAKHKFHAVILESPFSSVVSVAQNRYWFAPVNLLLKDKFNSIAFAPEISSPVLIFHGTADDVVRFEEGQKLYHAIKSPKKFIEIQGAGHLDFPGEFLAEETKKFLDDGKKKGWWRQGDSNS